MRGLELTASCTEENFSRYCSLPSSCAMAKTNITGQYNCGQDGLDFIGSHLRHLAHDQRLARRRGLSYEQKGTKAGGTFTAAGSLRADFATTALLLPYYQIDLSANRAFCLRSPTPKFASPRSFSPTRITRFATPPVAALVRRNVARDPGRTWGSRRSFEDTDLCDELGRTVADH